MGRKKSRDSYTSKGERRNVSKKWTKILRSERRENNRGYNQFDAYLKGKNVILTVPNPIKTETNKPYIRVKAKHYWRRVSND
tara:strand:- start:346 stop:591 length:246 start_codon:yes stop_codon:yes gene_type:complete